RYGRLQAIPRRCWCRRHRCRCASWAEHRAEIEVVAKGARPDMVEDLWSQKYRWRRQGDDRHPHAVPDRLGAEGIARYRIEHADQIGRHRNRLALFADHAPRDDPFVLKREFEPLAAVFVEPFDDTEAAQKSLSRPPRHI